MKVNPNVMLIATRKYKQFVPDMVRYLDRHFLPKHEIAITVFADELMQFQTTKRVQMVWTRIGKLGWPYATLYRYEIFSKFTEYLKKFSHLYYLDVDMALEDDVNDEFLVDGLIAVRHPGCYASDRWGSPNNPQRSTSWFPEDKRKHYYCGGVQGGKSEHYIEAINILAKRIKEDESKNVMAEWHDETHWNWYTNFHKPELVTELSPAYCMPQKKQHQIDWGLSEFQPKIIALDKNHKEIRA